MSNADQLREHIRALTEFERDYRRYIEAQEAEEEGREPELAEPERAKLRRDLLRRVGPAERALRQADMMPTVAPPPAIGGQALTSLSDQVFAHETPLFGSGVPWLGIPFGLADTMVAAVGALEDQLERARKEPARAPTPTRPKGAEPARAAREPWYHNQWVVVVAGGAIATVVGGIILALVL